MAEAVEDERIFMRPHWKTLHKNGRHFSKDTIFIAVYPLTLSWSVVSINILQLETNDNYFLIPSSSCGGITIVILRRRFCTCYKS